MVARVATSAVGLSSTAVPDPVRSAREVLVVELLVIDMETATLGEVLANYHSCSADGQDRNRV